MDSQAKRDDLVSRLWHRVFGGAEANGAVRLFGFIAAFVLLGGTIFAALLSL